MSDKLLVFLILFSIFINKHSNAKEFPDNLLVYRELTKNEFNMPSNGLKVFWWNIDCGLETEPKKIKGNLKTTNLESNLINLSESILKPDVLILGEFCPYYMSDEDQKKLIGLYKYKIHIERNIPKHMTSTGKVNQRNGFLILSDLPLNLIKNEPLYANNNSVESNDNRRYILLNVSKNGKEYLINPVHLVNPWREIYKLKGFMNTATEITAGEQNANAIQVNNLLKKFDINLKERDPFLIIGDFNSPGSIMGFSGYGYRKMQEKLFSLNADKDDSTFLGDGVFPATNIDHVFGVYMTVLYSEIWPLKGSRHLPLYIVIQ